MFQKGANWKGNRHGRPKAGKSLAEFIRVKTKNGREIAQYYYQVWHDPKEPTEMRMKAAEKLEFRAFGRYAQPVTGDSAEPVSIVLWTNVDPFCRPEE